MRAFILAAGRGQRMGELTLTRPKPLLEVRGKPLIVWHIEALARAGVRDLVINQGWLGEQLPRALGDGAAWGVRIQWSPEGWPALETGGGMQRALQWLGPAPFIAVNADIHTDYDYAALPADPPGLAHLVLVDNPLQHPHGDFHLDDQGRVLATPEPRLTFAGIGVYRPELLAGHAPGAFPLAPLLRHAMARSRVTGVHHRGYWSDIGTPERLAAANA